MIVWLLFLLFIGFWLLIDRFSKNGSKFAKVIIAIAFVWFAGLRDGFGADYPAYMYRIHCFGLINFTFNFFDEPTFTLIAYIIKTTQLSPYFYFFCMSLVTLPLVLYYFYKHPMSYYSILLFVLIPGIGFLQTFNQVRQAGAMAFFGIACLFLEKSKKVKKDWIMYICLVLVAALFHTSALILLVVPLLCKLRFDNRFWLLVVLIATYFMGSIELTGLQKLGIFFEKYVQYFDSSYSRERSSIFLIISIIMAYIICNKKAIIKSQSEEYVFTLGYICVLLYNLSSMTIAFSRMACYFAPMLLVLLSLPARSNIVYRLGTVLIFAAFFGVYLFSSPEPYGLLPFSILFD
jgi:hypothetical protein